MTKKQLSILSITILIAASFVFSTNEVFATSVTNYKMADNTYAKVKFTFRDGIEEIYFPVFTMTSDLINNDRPTFRVQGTVGDYPYLHEALNEAYKYRLATSSIEYDFKRFVVDVDLIRDGVSQKNLHYYDCSVIGASVETLTDDSEGYTTPTKTGFAVVDTIDFACSGMNLNSVKIEPNYNAYYQNSLQNYSKVKYTMAENVHSWATFTFNEGSEKIDFPVFKLTSGFDEKATQKPSFSVQGIVQPHRLLDSHINKAKSLSGLSNNVANDDFDVKIDFGNDSKTFRTILFSDCRIDDYFINSQTDAEEGFTGKSGFALTEDIQVSCAGLDTKNYEELSSGNSTNPYMMGGRTHAIATITLPSGQKESIDFPFYKQTFTTSSQTVTGSHGSTKTNVIFLRLNPTFQLQGVMGDFPILYNVVDLIRTRGQVSGSDFQGLFRVDIDLVHDEQKVLSHHYTNCRVVNYQTNTAFDKEEGYVGANGFALVGIYDFECKGYQPDNPAYVAVTAVKKGHNEESSFNKKDTSDWRAGFVYKGKY